MSHTIAPPVHDTDPAELKPPDAPAMPTDPLVFDRATSDLIASRLGKLEESVQAISVAVLAIKASTDSIPKGFHDLNGHLTAVRADMYSLDHMVRTAMDSQTAIVTRQSQTESTLEELVHDVAIIKLHQPSVNGSIPPEE